MSDTKEKIIRWIVWKLSPSVLLWAVVRGASLVENSETPNVTYMQIYDAITKKYNLRVGENSSNEE